MLTKHKNKCLSPTPAYIYDEACLDVLTDRKVNLSAQYLECYNCKFQKWATLNGAENDSFLINTRYQLQLQATFEDNKTCLRSLKFDEHARYGWNLTNENCSQIFVKEAADKSYLPILGAMIVFFCFGTLWYMVKCIYRCANNRNPGRFNLFRRAEVTHDLGTPSDGAPLVVEQTPTKRKFPNRFKSIDVFRGFCIILMIFVNYGGGQYWFFKHSIWNGLTVADLVFPWFMWIMGMSISISVRARLRTAMPRKQLASQILQRALILIFLGVILNSHVRKSDKAALRFPGVLQRLGVTYLFVGLLETVFSKRASEENYSRFQDILGAWCQWLVILSVVAIHTCITFLMPVPGCPKGYLGPGGLHDWQHYENCTGGAAGYIDRLIFGKHIYTSVSCHTMYETKVPLDPEGILGTLTAILTVYLGVQAGRTLSLYANVYTRIYRWLTWGIVTGIIAGVLCNFSKENGVIPVNKNLWSLSFALALSSMAFFIQIVLHVLVDVTHKWGGRPFFYPGMNSIILYVGHVLAKNTFPFAWVPSYESHREYLIMNLWGTTLWVAISIVLYKKNIFFKL